MADVLNLVPKKDVFDGIMNGTRNELAIENTTYWKKRLMQPNSNDFKEFKTLRISCGSPDKFDFEIDDMQIVDNQFVITIKREEDQKPSAEELIKRIEEETDIINEVESNTERKAFKIPLEPEYVDVQEYAKEVSVPVQAQVSDLKTRVKELIDNFIKNKDVFVVPTSVAQVRSDGRIMGTIKKLMIDRDLDTTIELFGDETVQYKDVSDDMFIEMLKRKLNRYLSGNYVFVCLRQSGWRKWNTGENTYTLRIAARKRYLIGKR